ncbi:MAG: protein-L-isoaspartate O-methyltransferase, partial [Brevundimonas sp.]
MSPMNRRTLLTAGGAAALGSLAACDEQTMKTVQARLNPTQATGESSAVAPAGNAATEAGTTSAVSETVRMPSEPWTYTR